MKKQHYFTLFILGVLLFMSNNPVNAQGNFTWALTDTSSYITENDYTLIYTYEYAAGTAYLKADTWASPSACWPVTETSPPCERAFACIYYDDSANAEIYTQEFYDALRDVISTYSEFEDITDDIPGAGIAWLYSASNVWVAAAYFGVGLGYYVAVAEASARTADINNREWDSNAFKDLLSEIGEVACDELGIDTGNGDEDSPGFTFIIGFTAIIATYLFIHKKRR